MRCPRACPFHCPPPVHRWGARCSRHQQCGAFVTPPGGRSCPEPCGSLLPRTPPTLAAMGRCPGQKAEDPTAGTRGWQREGLGHSSLREGLSPPSQTGLGGRGRGTPLWPAAGLLGRGVAGVVHHYCLGFLARGGDVIRMFLLSECSARSVRPLIACTGLDSSLCPLRAGGTHVLQSRNRGCPGAGCSPGQAAFLVKGKSPGGLGREPQQRDEMSLS